MWSSTALAGVSKRACSLPKSAEELAVAGHGVVDAGHGHGEGRESAEDGEQDAGGEDSAARRAEERLAELGDEGSVGDDALDRHDR